MVVFEKCRSATPEFSYRGTTIEWVQSFRYLGLELHSTRGMVVAIDKLTVAEKKALFALCRRCNDLSIADPEVLTGTPSTELCIRGVDRLYRGELQQAEQVHRMFMIEILGVNKTTSTFAMLGEFQRYPLEYFWWQQTLKYYDRRRESTPDRLLYYAY